MKSFLIISLFILTACENDNKIFEENFVNSSQDCERICKRISKQCLNFHYYNGSGKLASVDCE